MIIYLWIIINLWIITNVKQNYLFCTFILRKPIVHVWSHAHNCITNILNCMYYAQCTDTKTVRHTRHGYRLYRDMFWILSVHLTKSLLEVQSQWFVHPLSEMSRNTAYIDAFSATQQWPYSKTYQEKHCSSFDSCDILN